MENDPKPAAPAQLVGLLDLIFLKQAGAQQALTYSTNEAIGTRKRADCACCTPNLPGMLYFAAAFTRYESAPYTKNPGFLALPRRPAIRTGPAPVRALSTDR